MSIFKDITDLVGLLQSFLLLLRSGKQTVPRQLKVLHLVFNVSAGVVTLFDQTFTLLSSTLSPLCRTKTGTQHT